MGKKFKTVSVKNLEKNESDLIEFKEGERNRIHPNFTNIENYDCKIVYSKKNRFFIVDFSPLINKFTKNYTRTIISNDVNYIVEQIKKLQEFPLHD